MTPPGRRFPARLKAPEVTAARAPLRGRRIVVTRAESQAGGLLDRLRSLGADAVAVPVIAIEPVAEPPAVREAMARLRRHAGPAYAIFASANAVRLVTEALGEEGPLAAHLGGVAVGAMGPETSAVLTRAGVTPALVPAEFRAEAMASALAARGLEGARVWLPAAAGTRDLLRRRLQQAGAEVDVFQLYRSRLPEGAPARLARELDRGPVDAVAFTSGSTVDHFCQALAGRPFPQRTMAACIGPVTAAVARRAGLPVGVVAPRATAAALADALASHYR